MCNANEENRQDRPDTSEVQSKERQGEETLIRTLDLPAGKDYVWFADCNVVALGRHLDVAGRERALAQALGRYAQA
jgi:hypothetical protein